MVHAHIDLYSESDYCRDAKTNWVIYTARG